MKVIVTGVTGWLGEEVLRQSVAHPKITEIVALARKDLKDEFKDEKKIKLVKIEDFGSYSDEALETLKGSDGCIWTLGTVPGKGESGVEYLRRVNVDWTKSAAETFSSKWTLPEGRKFVFIYTSGILMPDPDKLDERLWFSEDLRKIRTHADKAILDMAEEGKLIGIVGKPGFITENETLFSRLSLGMMSISRQAMAASYIDMFVNGHPSGILRNGDMKKHGAEVLKKQKLEANK